MGALKPVIARLLPRSMYRALLSPYHYLWAFGSALVYGFPGKKLTVIGVTGTKGKSSVCEMLTAVLEAHGYKVVLSSTIRFSINGESRPNLYKMTLPGRGFLQKFLRDALDSGSTHVVIELTSESALQYRHSFTYLNALVFTNLQKEHIESHGSMEKYFGAKFSLGKELARSPKRPRAIIANADDEYGKRFLELPVEQKIDFSFANAQNVRSNESGISFEFAGMSVSLKHPGKFSLLNAIATLKAAEFLGVPLSEGAETLAAHARIPGRAERIDRGQDFLAVVDYAHTPDSLSALYDAFKDKRKICVLGNTGGGRDTWKRPDMGRIADEACAHVILTDEDPYDEDPKKIVDEMAAGMKRTPKVIMDRREAIREALILAQPGDAVLITGKGTDPYIMQAGGKKLEWSDARVVAEELERMKP
ncbi:MAG: UDP-N-acetylmuramoyl-L-alanyl-D-glutamate--2,6-diaminopimelate ligase [Parcubacteria bacterium C7867-001]|nr:MAG: UDP-N-acetylmuramoyl-L-alanyl-D-glutamate--2,6-diaminopimelate ligase [Parcubacteria bacterium C7867-001]